MSDGPHFTLVIETSTPGASLALVRPDGEIIGEMFRSDRHHNAALFGPLAALLSGVPVEEIGLVLVGSGPGSYSGTRVGIAAAQGIALAADCPCAAVPSILATPSAAGKCLAIGDARRGSWWIAEMENRRLVSEPALYGETDFREIISPALAASVPVISFEEISRFPVHDASLIREETPSSALLHAAWLASTEETRQRRLSEIPQPIYLKPPHITPGKRASLV